MIISYAWILDHSIRIKYNKTRGEKTGIKYKSHIGVIESKYAINFLI